MSYYSYSRIVLEHSIMGVFANKIKYKNKSSQSGDALFSFCMMWLIVLFTWRLYGGINFN